MQSELNGYIKILIFRQSESIRTLTKGKHNGSSAEFLPGRVGRTSGTTGGPFRSWPFFQALKNAFLKRQT